MSVKPHQSDEELAKQLLKQVKEVLDHDEKELKKLDEIIEEATRKYEAALHPKL
jgi:hypothetical protein